jgi:hypothetical protein
LERLGCSLGGLGRDLPIGKGAPDGLQLFVELIGGHASSFGIKVPPTGARDFRESFAASQNGWYVDSVFRGLSQLPRRDLPPALPGTPAAIRGGLCVSGWFVSPNQRDLIRAVGRFGQFAAPCQTLERNRG